MTAPWSLCRPGMEVKTVPALFYWWRPYPDAKSRLRPWPCGANGHHIGVRDIGGWSWTTANTLGHNQINSPNLNTSKTEHGTRLSELNICAFILKLEYYVHSLGVVHVLNSLFFVLMKCWGKRGDVCWVLIYTVAILNGLTLQGLWPLKYFTLSLLVLLQVVWNTFA